MSKSKKRRRPRRTMPDLIPDTPENVARALMQTPPPESWDYLKAEKAGKQA